MARFKLEDLPARYRAQLEAVPPRLPHPKPKPDARENTLGEGQDEKGRSGRLEVRIVRHGTKLLDKDNLYGSVKFLCDALRYENLIPADDPESIELIVEQKKVKKDATGTTVEIKPL